MRNSGNSISGRKAVTGNGSASVTHQTIIKTPTVRVREAFSSSPNGFKKKNNREIISPASKEMSRRRFMGYNILLIFTQISVLLKEIIIAIQSYNDARQFIRDHGRWKWILVPGLLYTILFLTGMYFFIGSATSVIEYLTQVSRLSEWIQKLENSWVGFLFALSGIMFWLLLLQFYFSLFKYAWLIIGSPIFTYLSEKTQSSLEEKEYEFSRAQFLRDLRPGLKVALRNAVRQSGYMLLLILLSIVPVAGMIAPVIALFVECYYYGYSMLSYSLDRRKVTPANSDEFIREHKGLAIGNGLVFYLLHILIPLAPAYAIIAANFTIHKTRSA